jgi:hypothetical protein
MDMLSLQKIEQRVKEGYYEADADTLRTMQQLVAEIRRLREVAESEVPEEVV